MTSEIEKAERAGIVKTVLWVIDELETEIKSLENDIPTRHGGDFAKKYATNALRAFAGRLRSLAFEEDDF